MKLLIDYEAPVTWTVELEPSSMLANSYIDGGDGFSTSWKKDSGEKYNW
ncbi:MAG: hypothetical protein J5699_05550 [Bacteroidales bacterium]|nr:hypothetical protein [Bacteroidales bacterium]